MRFISVCFFAIAFAIPTQLVKQLKEDAETGLAKQNQALKETNADLMHQIEQAVGEGICEGKGCGECLNVVDGGDYVCAFYDGQCILSESMKNPADYKASKFVWSPENCPVPAVPNVGDICEGKGCGECLDDTDYACAFYDGKCILSESMKNPADYKASKFVWSSGDCPVAGLPDCTCPSYQTGATIGTEMCQFGDNCALGSNFDSCPSNAIHCVLTTTTESPSESYAGAYLVLEQGKGVVLGSFAFIGAMSLIWHGSRACRKACTRSEFTPIREAEC